MHEANEWPDMAEKLDTPEQELMELSPVIDEEVAAMIAIWHAARMRKDFYATFGHCMVRMLQWAVASGDTRKRIHAVAFALGVNNALGYASMREAERAGEGSAEYFSRLQAEVLELLEVPHGPNSKGRVAKTPGKESFSSAKG
jgi:hypothetical protein